MRRGRLTPPRHATSDELPRHCSETRITAKKSRMKNLTHIEEGSRGTNIPQQGYKADRTTEAAVRDEASTYR